MCATLAARQKGVVSRAQLLERGLSPAIVSRLIRAGSLHRLHRGVYAVGHCVLPEFGREQAALLACGAGAVLGGRSALYLWGILERAPIEVDVIVAGRHCRKQAGIRTHRVDTLKDRDLRTRHGLSLVFPARALIEYADAATREELDDAVAEARISPLLRDGELEAATKAAGWRRGVAQMRAFLRDEQGPAITRSRAERRFRRILQDARLPQPESNALLAGLLVDFLWEAEKVVLEVDGYRFHSHRRAFETDRERDRRLADAGHHVIRVTWRHFTQEPLALIAHIARMLDRRRVT